MVFKNKITSDCCGKVHEEQCSRCSKKEITTRKILDAASKIFAEVGFEGARVDEIAKVAGVNKATLYYNIGDKETLYAAVIHDVIGESAKNLIDQMVKLENPEEKLSFFISRLVQRMYENPYLPKILMRENAGGGKNLPAIIGNDFKMIVGLLISILDEGKEKGVFRDVNPLILHMMVIGGISFLQTTEPIRKKFNVFTDKDNLSVETIQKEILNILLTAVRKD